MPNEKLSREAQREDLAELDKIKRSKESNKITSFFNIIKKPSMKKETYVKKRREGPIRKPMTPVVKLSKKIF